LILVGRGDGIRASLQACAADAGIAGNVHFVQDRCDLDSLYQAADIAILPSHEEGFPNAVIEAMAAGLPVIATDVGGIPDAIEHGQTGLIVPPRQPAALGAAILELARDPVRRRQFGQNGRSKIEAEFSLPLCADRYVRLYQGLSATTPQIVSELVS
jgi:glycosyltransferase involved in cell wall biosynthesis